MKLKNIIYTMLGAAALLSSCSDSFLDEKMYSKYGTNVTDVNSKCVGLYYKYGHIWGWEGRQGFVGIWQDGTDVGSPGDTEGVEVPFYKYSELNSENGGVSFLWESLYSMIDAANQIINSQNADVKYVAEAKFFRAYAYNMLVNLWGAVPLVTESTTTPRTDFTRTPVAEVDQLIESDLNDAIANLPSISDREKAGLPDRVTKDAARMLASEAFLRIGMRDNSYFAKAEQAVSPVIEEGNYQLISQRYGSFVSEPGDYYHDMFRWGNQRRSQGNTEGIWTYQMEYNRDVPGGTIHNPQQRRNWVPAFHKISGMVNADSIGGRGNGRLRLSNYVKYGLFQEGDIRNSNFNIKRTIYYNKPGFSADIWVDAEGFRVAEGTAGAVKKHVQTGDKVYWQRGDTLAVMYPHPTKWGAYDTSDDFGYAMVKDWPVMRLAEAYLLRAEARMQQGKKEEAAADINVLRDRAFKDYRISSGNPEAGKVSATDMNIDFILDERIRELVSEENRRMTLVRTGKLAERWEKYHDRGDKVPENKLSSGFDANKHVLLPIPLSEVQLNKDANLEQNPGY